MLTHFQADILKISFNFVLAGFYFYVSQTGLSGILTAVKVVNLPAASYSYQ